MNSNESVVSADSQQTSAQPATKLLCFTKGTDPKDSRKEAWISTESGKTWRVYVADPSGPLPSADGEVWLCEEVSHSKVRNGISDLNRVVVSLKHKVMDDMACIRFVQRPHRHADGKLQWQMLLNLTLGLQGQKVLVCPNKRHIHLLSPDRPCWKCKFKFAPHASHDTNFYVVIVDLIEEDTKENISIAFARKRTKEAEHVQKRVKHLRDEYDIEHQGQWQQLQTTKKPGRGVIRRP